MARLPRRPRGSALTPTEAKAEARSSLSEQGEDHDDDDDVVVVVAEKVDILEDRSSVDPPFELNRRDLPGSVTRSLIHEERSIIEQQHQAGPTLRELGELLAPTESRVRRIHANVRGVSSLRSDRSKGTRLM